MRNFFAVGVRPPKDSVTIVTNEPLSESLSDKSTSMYILSRVKYSDHEFISNFFFLVVHPRVEDLNMFGEAYF